MKIVSLLPSGTEILFALGLGDQVIGVTDLCDFPKEASRKPVVCRSKIDVSKLSSEQVEQEMHRILSSGESPYDLNQEWLLEHAPSVVLTQDLCYFCEVDAGTVGKAVQGFPAQPEVVVLNPHNLAEIFESIRRVGEVCGAAEKSERLVEDLQNRVKAVRERAAADTPRVFSLEGINPLVIGGHWIPELLQIAGGLQDRYPPGCAAARIRWQEVLDYAPEKLFIDLCSSDLARHMREISWLARQDGFYDLPAVQSGEVYLIDHVYFSRPGPRVVQGLEILAQLTHPELFTGQIPENTVVKLDVSLMVGTDPDQLAQCFRPYPPSAGETGCN